MQIFIQRIYSFKNFRKFIHSKKSEIIHSMKIFIHLKNGLSPTPTDPRQKNYTEISLSCFEEGKEFCPKKWGRGGGQYLQ